MQHDKPFSQNLIILHDSFIKIFVETKIKKNKQRMYLLQNYELQCYKILKNREVSF